MEVFLGDASDTANMQRVFAATVERYGRLDILINNANPGRRDPGASRAYLEISEEQVLDGLQTNEAYDTVSLDAPRNGDEETENRIEALGSQDERLDLVDDQATVFAAAQHLPERERRILYLRFGEDLTQAEIARRIGVSQMQVSRLLRKSVQRLRDLTEERPQSAQMTS